MTHSPSVPRVLDLPRNDSSPSSQSQTKRLRHPSYHESPDPSLITSPDVPSTRLLTQIPSTIQSRLVVSGPDGTPFRRTLRDPGPRKESKKTEEDPGTYDPFPMVLYPARRRQEESLGHSTRPHTHTRACARTDTHTRVYVCTYPSTLTHTHLRHTQGFMSLLRVTRDSDFKGAEDHVGVMTYSRPCDIRELSMGDLLT